jgi:hypothetical protein
LVFPNDEISDGLGLVLWGVGQILPYVLVLFTPDMKREKGKIYCLLKEIRLSDLSRFTEMKIRG